MTSVSAHLPHLLKYKFRYFVTMALTYLDAIDQLYGRGEFTARDLRVRLANPRAAKLLSELKRRGHVARVGRGRFRRLDPAERPDLRWAEWRRVREVVLGGPGPMAWTGESAVELWTDGRYRVTPSVFCRVYSIAVPRGNVRAWRRYLSKFGISINGRKRVGARVELHPVDSLEVTFRRSEPVISRNAVVRLIRAHPAIFANAEELVARRP